MAVPRVGHGCGSTVEHSLEGPVIRIVCVTLAAVLVASVAFAQSAAVERGKAVYAAQKCSVCHSIGGVGNKRGALDEVGSKLTADEIRQWIVDAAAMTAKTKATRKPPMRSYTDLPQDDVDGLVVYMQSLSKR